MQSKSLPNNYPGKRIGLYEIVKEIGNGAFGKVVAHLYNPGLSSQKRERQKWVLKILCFEVHPQKPFLWVQRINTPASRKWETDPP